MKLNKILAASAILFASIASNAAEGIANITNRETDLTVSQAIEIYTGKTTFWPNGQSIVVVVLPREHSVSREFIYNNLGISPYQFYESLNISVKIRKNNSVIVAASEGEVVKTVIRYEGSIGYTSDYIYYNYKDDVKRVKIK